jgi:hypothetical protein
MDQGHDTNIDYETHAEVSAGARSRLLKTPERMNADDLSQQLLGEPTQLAARGGRSVASWERRVRGLLARSALVRGLRARPFLVSFVSNVLSLGSGVYVVSSFS